MTREELYKIVSSHNLLNRHKGYKLKKVDGQWVELINEINRVWYSTWIRVQNGTLLTSGSFSVIVKPFEKEFKNLIVEDLINNYDVSFTMGFNKFYQTDYRFDITIEKEEDWQTFLSEFDKCLRFYETEVFPKLTDIDFLAKYVGVPWENHQNVVVGGSYPVSFFKKLAILKWGNQLERYEEYKKEIKKFIDEDYEDPKYGHEAKIYEKGYSHLIHHLENGPKPFKGN